MSHYPNKPDLSLLPPEALWECALLLSQHTDRDGELPGWASMAPADCYRKYRGSVLRHIWRWLRGEQIDQDSKRHHLAHVATNALILLAAYLDDTPHNTTGDSIDE